ncbi:MAG TPA: hypothetical protein DDY37_06935, partial [Legionella sp.]|nr:hypothetical protein [Legionella sp.]
SSRPAQAVFEFLLLPGTSNCSVNMLDSKKIIFNFGLSRTAPIVLMVILACFICGFVLFLYSKRVIFPDVAFDTINYHFFLGKEGVENFPKMFKPSEFFPLGMHSFNPLVDSFNYIVYSWIGYRFGTIFSAISLVLTLALAVAVVLKVVGPRVSLVAAIFIIPALIVNEGLFQVATYYTDNHYAFLVLSYVYALVGFKDYKLNFAFVLRVFIMGLLGGLLTTKLTNVVYVIPLFVATIYLGYAVARNTASSPENKKYLLLAIFGFLVPALLPSSYYFLEAFRLSGNPVFPFYNGIFNSPYYLSESWEFNFGPKGLLERLFFPYFAFIDPVRLGEAKDLFPDVKLITTLSFLIVAAVALLMTKIRFSKAEIVLIFVTLGCQLVWQVLFGYSRYSIALEILLGLSVVVLVNKLMLSKANYFSASLIVFYLMLSMWQSFNIVQFNFKYDIAWRPLDVSYNDWKIRFFSREMLNKFTIYDSQIANKLKRVDVVVQCVNPSSAYFSTFPELVYKPMLNFDKGSNGAMTTNVYYIKERDESALNAIGKGANRYLNFAIVLNDTNKGMKSLDICLATLDQEKQQGRVLEIHETIEVDNFVGDPNQKLMVMLGRYYSQAPSGHDKL